MHTNSGFWEREVREVLKAEQIGNRKNYKNREYSGIDYVPKNQRGKIK